MEKERARKYELVVALTNKGYFKAKISFVGKGRIEGGGKTEELAVLNTLDKLMEHIQNLFASGALRTKICNLFLQRFQESVLKLKIDSPDVMQKTFEIVNLINQVNASIVNSITASSNVISFNNHLNARIIRLEDENIKVTDVESKKRYLIDEVAINWKNYEIGRTKGTVYNQRQIKRTTVDGYIRIMNSVILPFLKKRRLLYIDQVKEHVINDCIASANGYDNKRHLDIVFRLFFKYLVEEKLIKSDLMSQISKPVKPKLNREKKIKCIKVENQDKYLDMFETEKTDLSILFMVLLECGCRPEEGCSLKWSNLLVNQKVLVIDSAIKDVAKYNKDGVKIGMERIEDGLKTETSYRTIPIPDRLLRRLLLHKEAQEERFKNSIKMSRKKRKFSENGYMFISRTFRPYSSVTLNKELKKMCNKYNLAEVTPYMLRRSFATKCFNSGVRESVIAEIMGHGENWSTTKKYYVDIEDETKKEEMKKVFEDRKIG